MVVVGKSIQYSQLNCLLIDNEDIGIFFLLLICSKKITDTNQFRYFRIPNLLLTPESLTQKMKFSIQVEI